MRGSCLTFSAPYIFGGNFRVMTTRIVASRLNGDLEMAMTETVTLAVVALIGLLLLQASEKGREVAGAVRGIAPERRALLGSRFLVAALAWLSSTWPA